MSVSVKLLAEHKDMEELIERLEDQVADLQNRIRRAGDKMEALRDLVGMAQQQSALTRAGAGNARVYVEEILGILDDPKYLT